MNPCSSDDDTRSSSADLQVRLLHGRPDLSAEASAKAEGLHYD